MSPCRPAISVCSVGQLASMAPICWVKVVTLCSASRRFSSA
jgi:hypothetical protein